MSQWTHVAGVIRIDGLPGMMPEPDFGVTATYEEYKKFDDVTVPLGSEGSLQYKLDKVGDGLVWYNCTIWGDLRDYDNSEEIIEWIKTKTKDLMIRQGVIHIDVESTERITLVHQADGWVQLNL